MSSKCIVTYPLPLLMFVLFRSRLPNGVVLVFVDKPQKASQSNFESLRNDIEAPSLRHPRPSRHCLLSTFRLNWMAKVGCEIGAKDDSCK